MLWNCGRKWRYIVSYWLLQRLLLFFCDLRQNCWFRPLSQHGCVSWGQFLLLSPATGLHPSAHSIIPWTMTISQRQAGAMGPSESALRQYSTKIQSWTRNNSMGCHGYGYKTVFFQNKHSPMLLFGTWTFRGKRIHVLIPLCVKISN